MKKIILFLSLFFVLFQMKGQESFRKFYWIPNQIKFNKYDSIPLLRVRKVMFKDLKKDQQDSIREVFPTCSKIEVEFEEMFKGKKRTISRHIIVNEAFYQEQFIEQKDTVKRKGIKGLVKFDKNKLIVNPKLIENPKDSFRGHNESYFFELKNRQTAKFYFQEVTLNALTIPIKYRFRDKSSNVEEEFSTSFNANLFLGYTFCGRTYFNHRRDVGNKSNYYKWTIGGFIGASTVTMTANNTSADPNPIPDDGTEIAKGLTSIGLGITYSFNKINFGGFVGWDYAIGEDANKWNYNKAPWVGLALGYSLFQL